MTNEVKLLLDAGVEYIHTPNIVSFRAVEKIINFSFNVTLRYNNETTINIKGFKYAEKDYYIKRGYKVHSFSKAMAILNKSKKRTLKVW